MRIRGRGTTGTPSTEGELDQGAVASQDDVRPIMTNVSDLAGRSAQPPADALLWRVQGLHNEVACYAVAADTGVVSASQPIATTTSWSPSLTRPSPQLLNARQFSARV